MKNRAPQLARGLAYDKRPEKVTWSASSDVAEGFRGQGPSHEARSSPTAHGAVAGYNPGYEVASIFRLAWPTLTALWSQAIQRSTE
ncbi:hypothetical protein D3C80_1803740 [compost metagenome]